MGLCNKLIQGLDTILKQTLFSEHVNLSADSVLHVYIQARRQGGFHVTRKPPFHRERGGADTHKFTLTHVHIQSRRAALNVQKWTLANKFARLIVHRKTLRR